MSNQQETTVLIIEDDPGHSRLIEKNLQRTMVGNKMVKIDNGRDALDYLFSSGKFSDHIMPQVLLVILDLNLPGVSGVEILKTIKNNKERRMVPVIVLTTSNEAEDVARCYELGCNMYVKKPLDYDKFSEAIRNLGLLVSVVSVPVGRMTA